MSRMSELFTEIQEELESGLNPYIVAKKLNVPLEIVEEVEAELYGDLYEDAE
jgi:hypothetical protein